MLKRVHQSILYLIITFLVGVAGYMVLGGPRWSLLDSIFMTAITMSTVGYEEVHDLNSNPPARIFTILLVVTGYAVVIYASATITAFLVEGELERVMRRRRMGQKMKVLKDHYIICGGGETGMVILEELSRTGRSFVLVENDKERASRLLDHYGDDLHLIEGDATEDEVLIEAGIQRARGMVVALQSDKDTLFVTLTARQLNREMRIVVRGVDSRSKDKFVRAGADSVVSSNHIGGMRLASEMIRPAVVGFLDEMLRDPESSTRFEELYITPNSKVAGKSIEDAKLFERAGVLVIAYRRHGSDRFVYNPSASTVLEADSVVVVLGDSVTMPKIRAMIA